MKTTTKKTSQKLPNKPSALILLALHDLAKVERQNTRFVVDMGTWVKRLNGKCAVCLAGSVIVGTLGMPLPEMKHDEVCPDDVNDARVSSKLYALNHFRLGEVAAGLSELNLDKPDGIPEYIKVFGYNSKSFKRDMRKMAALLAKHGQ